MLTVRLGFSAEVQMRLSLLFSLVLIVACKPVDGTDPIDTEDTNKTVDDTDTDPGDTDTTDTGDTDTDTVTTSLPTFDCATIPEQVQGTRGVPNAAGYHGLAFNTNDEIVGTDSNNNLVAVAFDGTGGVWVPNAGGMEQIAFLPNGDLAIATNSSVVRITPGGGRSQIANTGNVYGLVVGPDGMIYTADWNKIERIDPATGQKTTIIPNHSPKVVAFNHDGSKLFFGTISNSGNVYSVDLDANYDPIGGPVLVGSTPGSWHDGLGVDICGNVYIAEYNNNNLHRIGTQGGVQLLYDYGFGQYGHGLIWGSGSGGWGDTMLYVPQPYNGRTVFELDIGVPQAGWEGNPIGVSPF